MTIATGIGGLTRCGFCAAPVREHRDLGTGRVILTDIGNGAGYHECAQMADELPDTRLRCPGCGSLDVWRTNTGRLIEHLFPAPIPPYLDHVCVTTAAKPVGSGAPQTIELIGFDDDE